jgi:DNA repair protein RecO (recombination protein O)
MDKVARDHLQRCFVLHRRDYGNTSLIVEVFSSAYGRLPVLARGAKRGKAVHALLLRPFSPVWMSWTGRGEVRSLVRAEPAGRPIELPGKALFCGFYLNELLVRLLHRWDPHQDLFAFYHAALTGLAGGQPMERVLRQFELRLLHEIGYAPVLDREAQEGAPVVSGRRYSCDPGTGLRRLNGSEEGFSVSGETLLRLVADQPLSGATAREARELMRRLIAPHLGGRPLRSRELFRRLPGGD